MIRNNEFKYYTTKENMNITKQLQKTCGKKVIEIENFFKLST